MIETRLVPDMQEMLTLGEAVAGMIRNGLGFANRPLSCTLQFFPTKPLDGLFRADLDAKMFHRFKFGRTRDEVHASGCDLLFAELALAVCSQEGIERRFPHLDMPSFSRPGASVPDRDEHAMHVTHGSSKDHRPDRKQAVGERLGSQDGGVPFARKRWEGKPADPQVVQQRTEALRLACKDAPTPRYLVADATLDGEDNAVHLAKLGCITRLPATLTLVSQVMSQALQGDPWQTCDDHTRAQPFALCHAGMAQRWLVASSQAAVARANAAITQATQRAHEAIPKPLWPLQAQRFCPP